MADTRSVPSVAVVGAGPAGLMAAEVLAVAGVRVTVFERTRSAGRKLLLAGRGGLNVTHSEPFERFLGRYGAASPALAGALRRFGPADVRAWCDGFGEETFVGTSGRVFPTSFRATPLLRAWLRRLDGLGVELRSGHRWTGWDATGRLRFDAGGPSPVVVDAAATMLALGGASWPRTGSDGGWVPLVRELGVEVVALRPANCGFTVGWSDELRARFAGAPVKNVTLRFAGSEARGDLVITASGIEGGPVYALSATLRDALARGEEVVVQVDLRPDLAVDTLAERLGRRRPKETQSTALRRLAGVEGAAAAVLRDATGNDLPREPEPLAARVKSVPLRVLAPQPLERAISTAGGIALGELDDAFMLRRRPGTFAVGEMLDWEAPTGGYLLTAVLATAVHAASGALRWLGVERPVSP